MPEADCTGKHMSRLQHSTKIQKQKLTVKIMHDDKGQLFTQKRPMLQLSQQIICLTIYVDVCRQSSRGWSWWIPAHALAKPPAMTGNSIEARMNAAILQCRMMVESIDVLQTLNLACQAFWRVLVQQCLQKLYDFSDLCSGPGPCIVSLGAKQTISVSKRDLHVCAFPSSWPGITMQNQPQSCLHKGQAGTNHTVQEESSSEPPVWNCASSRADPRLQLSA